MTPRQAKSRVRKSGFRDARLIVIATEGVKTERKYFYDLASNERFRNPRVHVEILERDSNSSSPEHVLREIDEFRRKYGLNLTTNDELWIVIDVDRWGSETLKNVAAKCLQKRYSLAVSNPCFEIWLILHRTSIDDFTDDERNSLLKNEKSNGRTQTEQKLIVLCGSYNKSNLNSEHFIPFVEIAIERAQQLDSVPSERWPNQLGTRVYRLAQSIISLQSKSFSDTQTRE